MCVRTYREKRFLRRNNMTTRSDKAARYKRAVSMVFKCVLKHSHDYYVGITHSYVRFIWIRHLAGHIQYTHLKRSAWISFWRNSVVGNGEVWCLVAFAKTFRNTLESHAVPWTSPHMNCVVKKSRSHPTLIYATSSTKHLSILRTISMCAGIKASLREFSQFSS